MDVIAKMKAVSEAIQLLIAGLEEELRRSIASAEAAFLAILLSEWMPTVEFRGGYVAANEGNILSLSKVSELFSGFKNKTTNRLIFALIKDLSGVAASLEEYYKVGGFVGDVAGVAKNNANLMLKIGVNKGGEVISEGWAGQLIGMEAVETAIKNKLLTSVMSGHSKEEFVKETRRAIIDLAPIDKHFQDFGAYDSYNQVREIKNLEYADKLGLRHFIYQGSVIAATRAFCKKKAGKVWTTEDAMKWPNDPDLIGKLSGIPYRPLIDRGRWNCRHWLDYISEEMATLLQNQN